jgi:glycosyltransferase involved in cell wall biosynthesis
MQKADEVICVSKSIKEYIQKNYNTDEKKITVIPRGIDLDVFNPKNIDKEFIENFKKKYQLEGKFIVSSVGRITQLKDYETFIKAIKLVQKEKKDIIALIVGGVRSDKEEYLGSLKTLIKELDLQENIIFTGSQSKIAEIYALSDVVVSSSKKPESFGRAVAEAIALNTPVIATNHGGVKDIIVEKENGFFFEVGDEVELFEGILKAENLDFDGYEYISKNFSLESMLGETLGVYGKANKMSICIIIAGKFEKLAGLEKHFIELVKGLCNKVNISVIAHSSYSSQFKDSKVNFTALNLNTSRHNFLVYYKLYKLLKSRNFDIVHTQANKATFIISKIKRFLPKTKFVATLHNKKKKINYFNKMDLTIGVSDFVCNQLKSNTKTIYNGIDVEKFIYSDSFDLRENIGIKNNYPTLLSIGRLVSAKGFDLLIKAVKDLDVNIVILGDGKEQNNLDDLININNLTQKVFIIGFKDNVNEYIKSSDGVIISSRNEGFSYVFAETLCSRKTLISTNVADIKNFIPSELLIKSLDTDDIKNTIKYFLANRSKLNLNKYYDIAIKKLSVKNMIEETYQEYKKIVKS